MANHLSRRASRIRWRYADMQPGLPAAVGNPAHMTHDPEIDDAENGYLRVRHGLEDIPDPAVPILTNRHGGSYHCAPG